MRSVPPLVRPVLLGVLPLVAAVLGCRPDAPAVVVAPPTPDVLLDPTGWEAAFAPEERVVHLDGIVMKLGPGIELLTKDVTPIAGAKVESFVPSPDGRGRVMAGPPVTTGADGLFRAGPFPQDGWIVRVTKDGSAPAWIGGGIGLATAGVVLPPGTLPFRAGSRQPRPLAGRVLDDAGRGIAGANVTLVAPAYREELTTDGTGNFAAIPIAAPVIVEVTSPAHESERLVVRVPTEGAVPDVVVKLHAADPLRGWVRSTVDGALVANAVVLSPENPSIRTRTGADGRFELPHAHGKPVAAFAEGFGWRSILAPKAGDAEIRLQPVATVTGTVVDAAGRPVEGARVLGVTRGYTGFFERVLGPRTGADGSFRFSWMPRAPRGSSPTPRIVAYRRGIGESPIVAVDTAPGKVCDVKLQLASVRDVRGVVRRASGEPVAGVAVSARWERSDVSAVEAAALGFPESQSTATDEAGRYELRAVPSSLHAKVVCELDGVTREVLLDQAAGDVDVTFEAGKTLAGRVLDARGAVPEGTVEIVAELLNAPGTQVTRSTTAAADGTFRFDDVPPGSYQLRASSPTYDLPAGKVAEASGEPTTLKLERTAALTVNFRFEGASASDVPLVVSLVPAQGAQEIRERIAAGATGWTRAGIIPGRRTLRVEGGVWRAIAEFDLGDGERRTMDLDVRRTLRVRAQLLDGSGRPVPPGQMAIVAPVPPTRGSPQTAETATEGALDLTGLTEGRWAVTIERPNSAALRQEFDVKTGENPPLALRLPASGSLSVHVTYEGRPIAGAVVVLTQEGKPLTAWKEGVPSSGDRFRVDEQGRVSIRGVRKGRVHVKVVAGASTLAERDVEVVPDSETPVDID